MNFGRAVDWSLEIVDCEVACRNVSSYLLISRMLFATSQGELPSAKLG